jgi:hypothetical protein
MDFAHYAIEVAIDFLLRANDPNLGVKLMKATLLRSWLDSRLLLKVFVWKNKRTDSMTLSLAEFAFRNLVWQYSLALSLPSPLDKKALVELATYLAEDIYGISVTPQEVFVILEAAIILCAPDYKAFIDYTINEIKGSL